ncbi:GspH/FimT family pseudopilin [Shewanella sp. cp20]|uniref:GspH/FimT family pseudopilin n=1 Tax=Shewanella sp. cp20 TaxID=1521167 RepID=UPI0005ADC8FD|nr:GspH/FimT family pseudopilin [Shewanella sp. cp20]KIO36190.1 methylation site containing protein [Shewanella sp. cp20]
MCNNNKGFTLVELMVTIAVAAILLTIGVPSLTSVYEQVRVNNNVEKIHDLFAFARNQAVSYGATVNVCSFATATSCGTTTDWSGGIRVYITDATNTDHELRAIDSFNSQDKVKASAISMTFSADGLSSGGTVIYCPNGRASDSKSVSLSTSGIVSYGTDGNAC